MLKLLPASLLLLCFALPAKADSFIATFICNAACTDAGPSNGLATFTPGDFGSITGVTWASNGWSFGLLPNWLPTDQYQFDAFKDTTASGASQFLDFRVRDMSDPLNESENILL